MVGETFKLGVWEEEKEQLGNSQEITIGEDGTVNQPYKLPSKEGIFVQTKYLFFAIHNPEYTIDNVCENYDYEDCFVMSNNHTLPLLAVKPQAKILRFSILEKGDKLHTGFVKYGDILKIRVEARNYVGETIEVSIYEDINWAIDPKMSETVLITISEHGYGEVDFEVPCGWEGEHEEGKEGIPRYFYFHTEGIDFPRRFYVGNVGEDKEKDKGNSNRVRALMLKVVKELPENEAAKDMANAVLLGEELLPDKVENSEVCETLIWGNKFTCAEREKVVQIASELWGEEKKIEMANELMICIALETGGKFTADVTKGDGIGLIQFTGTAVKDMNERKRNNGNKLSKKDLGVMTVLEQLDYVKLYFDMHMIDYKRTIENAMDMYMCILCPAAVGKDKDFVLYSKQKDKDNDVDYYESNETIDGEYYYEKKEIILKGKADGKITRGELEPRLLMWEAKGLPKKNTCKKDASTCDYGTSKGEFKGNESGVLEEMKKLADKHITYRQEGNEKGLRTNLTDEALKKMDCSEFVCRYLHKLGITKTVKHVDTGKMINESIFRQTLGSNNIDFVKGSESKDFVPQRGDIFVWRDGDGHTGIVYDYNASNDVVIILEAIGSRGASGESKQVANGGYSGKGCTRTAKYGRLDGAMYGHRGWLGFFRPKNYTKKL